MSRLSKKPIVLPAGVTVTVANGEVTVKGKLGELKRAIRPEVAVEITPEGVNVKPVGALDVAKPFLGTTVAHIKNMVAGVEKPFEKKLLVEGVGYKADIKGTELVMSLGFSHQVKVTLPADLKVTAEKNMITITGSNIESVGQFAAKVRAFKKPEPYKGKGVRYDQEVIRRKQGKKSV